jgi:hypothetical protein
VATLSKISLSIQVLRFAMMYVFEKGDCKYEEKDHEIEAQEDQKSIKVLRIQLDKVHIRNIFSNFDESLFEFVL